MGEDCVRFNGGRVIVFGREWGLKKEGVKEKVEDVGDVN